MVSLNPIRLWGSECLGINYMASLYRTTQGTQEGMKNSTTAFGVKNLNIRHRNYSNSRLQTYHPMELDFIRQPLDAKKRNEQTTSTNHSKELKKYCLNKFKPTPPA